jgi:hypothetical protein
MTLELIDQIRSDKKYNPHNSYVWFQSKVRELFGGGHISQIKMLSANQDQLTTQLLPGKMYAFLYDPKLKNELPYFDKFPLIIPWRKDARHFWGINFHYLPYQYRLTLLNKLMQFAQHNKKGEVAMLKFSWNLISSVSKFREAQPAIKCYLHGHVKTRFIQIPPEDWAIATMMPMANFAGDKETNVWKLSKQKMWGN